MADEVKKAEPVGRKVLHVREVIDDLFKQKEEIMDEMDPKALADRVAVLLHTLEDSRHYLENAYPKFVLDDEMEDFWGRLLKGYKESHRIGVEIDNTSYESCKWIDLDTELVRWNGAKGHKTKVYAEMYTTGGDHEFPVSFFRAQIWYCVRYDHAGGGYDQEVETFVFIPTQEEGNALVKVTDKKLAEKYNYVSHGNEDVDEGMAEYRSEDRENSDGYGDYDNEKMWAAFKAHCESLVKGQNDMRRGS